ncbi:hypothetical protein [Actinoplanes sp. CA-252034]|uniref:hypothetical protein n=1 Tax=Actinoplanes sp. CA-252034 TaxID=3239906 RepID=UPI003D983746
MAYRGSPAARVILTVVRVVTALTFALLGPLFAVGVVVQLLWEINAWPGRRGTTLGAVLWGLLGAVLLVGPMVAWWFLIPRVRWWGVPVTILSALATFGVFFSRL